MATLTDDLANITMLIKDHFCFGKHWPPWLQICPQNLNTHAKSRNLIGGMLPCSGRWRFLWRQIWDPQWGLLLWWPCQLQWCRGARGGRHKWHCSKKEHGLSQAIVNVVFHVFLERLWQMPWRTPTLSKSGFGVRWIVTITSGLHKIKSLLRLLCLWQGMSAVLS